MKGKKKQKIGLALAASALTKFVAKFRRIFARTKNENHRISFAFLLYSTVRVVIGILRENMWPKFAVKGHFGNFSKGNQSCLLLLSRARNRV